jgi:hypothetical protein
MPMPYRIPSPPPPEEPETEEPYAKVLRAQQRRARITAIVAGCAVMTLVLAAAARPAPAQTQETDVAKREEARRTRAREAIASARSRAVAEQERFAVAIRAAVASDYRAKPGAPGEGRGKSLGACPITLAQPTGIGRPFPLVVVDRSEVDTLRVPSQAIAEVLADIARAEQHMASGRYEEAVLYADALDRPGRLVVDVALVQDVNEAPKVTNQSTFVPGRLSGQAYLYEFASHRVVCATHAEASSGSSVGYAYAVDGPSWRGPTASLDATLTRELRTGIERSIATSMTLRAGP